MWTFNLFLVIFGPGEKSTSQCPFDKDATESLLKARSPGNQESDVLLGTTHHFTPGMSLVRLQRRVEDARWCFLKPSPFLVYTHVDEILQLVLL